MKIFINPGHCPGKDSGAVNPHTNLQECDVALAIGRRVKDYLISAGHECKLYQADSLSGICREANNWKADIFVSIHCNAANGTARGTETFHYHDSTNGKKLASAIHKQIIASIPTDYSRWNRGVKEAGFYVIKNTYAPAALVETAFIDNDTDMKLLLDYEDEFARAIAYGICDYCGVPFAIQPDAVVKDVVTIHSGTPISEDIKSKIKTLLSFADVRFEA